MSLAVVRCPACLGASGVAPEALGELVACPRCQVPFVAAEDVPVIQPKPRPAVAPRAALPVSPPRRPLLEPEEYEPEEYEPAESPDPATNTSPAEAHPVPDPEHDPHLPPPAGLPVSVLVGLALLPLAIPVLWWAAPMLTGQAAALSLAVPIALAFAASTLCLGVVYTIDWRAGTRIKGVLMLVGLAYLSAAGLYFLKKELVDGIRRFGRENPWQFVKPKGGDFRVKMPGGAQDVQGQPLPKLRLTAAVEAKYELENEAVYSYFAAAGLPENAAGPLDNDWFQSLGEEIATKTGGQIIKHGPVPHTDGSPGYEWRIQLPKGVVRVARAYAIKGRVYYFSVEGRDLNPADEEFVEPFFRSFEVIKPGEPPKRKARR